MSIYVSVVPADETRVGAPKVITTIHAPGYVFCPDAGGALVPLDRKSDRSISSTKHSKWVFRRRAAFHPASTWESSCSITGFEVCRPGYG